MSGTYVKPTKHWCAKCGVSYYSEGWHAERCDGKGVTVCDRVVYGMGRNAKHCWMPAGHKGPCG